MRRLQVDVAIVGGGIVGSFLAKHLVRRGVSVAVIETGGATLAAQRQAIPVVRCTARRHDGVYNARNHVLGGNGHYWGGGLVRPRSTQLSDVLGLNPDDDAACQEDVDRHFKAVELDIGVSQPPRVADFPVSNPEVGSCRLSEIFVLPGRARNIASVALKQLGRTKGCTILNGSDVIAFRTDSSRRVRGVRVACGDEPVDIDCNALVLCAGTVDTLLLLQRHGAAFGLSERDTIGAGLHDHISLPIAEVGLKEASDFRNLAFPTFRAGGVVGKRFEIGGGMVGDARGVLHFQFLFDEVSPYREIKQILALRQKGAGLQPTLMAAARAAAQLPDLCRIGYERYFMQRLYIGKTVPIVATLDFESAHSESNRIELDGEDSALMTWDLRLADERVFARVIAQANALLSELQTRYGLSLNPLGDFTTAAGRAAYLRDKATDAYHLGGGVRYGEVIDHQLRLSGSDNVYVVSCAVFQRPGLANPTMTLLALAHRCAEAICGRDAATG